MQAAHSNNIIDLTEADDDDDQLETLSEAASKAEAAAASLRRKFSTIGHNVTLNRQPPSENNSLRPTANINGIKSREGKVQGTQSSSASYEVRNPSLGPKIGRNEPIIDVRPKITLQLKRKRSAASPHLDGIAKAAKREDSKSRDPSRKLESLHSYERTTPTSVQLVTKQSAQNVRDATGSNGKRDGGISIPGPSSSVTDIGAILEVLLLSGEDAPISEIFNNVVYPVLEKAKRRANQSLTNDELLAIGTSVRLHYLISSP
jgi:hypothetical protein